MRGQRRASDREPADAATLFDIDFTRIAVGDAVVVQTMWGDENGTVTEVGRWSYAWPIAQVMLESGDTIYIDPARLRKS